MAAAYMSGFGNSFETEALPGALPVGRNSPQKVNYGLYAEQLSGSAFTAPRASNERSWLYRIRPTVRHMSRFARVDRGNIRTAPAREDGQVPIGPMRWSPPAMPQGKLTFVTGLHTVTTAGDAETLTGMASHLLFITESMTHEHISNADGEFLALSEEHKTCIYRIVQETLTNCARHAAARKAEVSLRETDSALEVRVHDDGRGFDPRARRQGGLGLIGIEERVRELGGDLHIESAAGKGTTLTVRFASVPGARS